MGIVDDARALAVEAHAGQLRKGTDRPYAGHPEQVAAIVRAHGGGDELVAAAWLHDVVEDTAYAHEDLLERFPARTLAAVLQVTEQERERPWEERKHAQLVRVADGGRDAALLKAADALANARDLARDLEVHGDAVWARFSRPRSRQLWWYRSLERLAGDGLGRDHPLVAELRAVVDRVCLLALRAPAPAELDAVLDLTERLFDAPGQRPSDYDRAAARRRAGWWISGEGRTLLVAERDEAPGELVGYVAAAADIESIRYGRRCWVEDLVVLPGERSHGHGAALLGAARGWARAAGCTHLELDTGHARADSQRFYAREGGDQPTLVYAYPLPPLAAAADGGDDGRGDDHLL